MICTLWPYLIRVNILNNEKTFKISKNPSYRRYLYNFYNVLSQGSDKEGSNIISPTGETPLSPGYPEQEVSKIALKAARTLDSILDEVIDIILPRGTYGSHESPPLTRLNFLKTSTTCF